jgi:hypothetical protein
MYTEQSGIIRLYGCRSAPFSFSNGIREGAAGSSILWAINADGIIIVLHSSGCGCHVAEVWMCAFLYVDDLALLAPTCTILAIMLALVESYGATPNLVFPLVRTPRSANLSASFFWTSYSCAGWDSTALETEYGAPLPHNPPGPHL